MLTTGARSRAAQVLAAVAVAAILGMAPASGHADNEAIADIVQVLREQGLTDEATDRQRRSLGPLTFVGGHHTVFQHATFEFALSGISRQLVWSFLHGFPFYNTEQQSQRYVRLDRIAAHVPPALAGEQRAIYESAVEGAWRAYRELTERLKPVTLGILSELWRLRDRQSVAFGKNVAREAEKKAIETARYVIPVACHTAMVYTVSGIVLHRLRRMARVGDVPDEAADVVGRMVAAVEKLDPDFFRQVGDAPLGADEIVESGLAPAGAGDPAALEAFEKSLDGRSSRLALGICFSIPQLLYNSLALSLFVFLLIFLIWHMCIIIFLSTGM